MKWEYKTVKLATSGFAGGLIDELKIDALLNQLGAEGWELISAFDTNQMYGASRNLVFVLKRARQ